MSYSRSALSLRVLGLALLASLSSALAAKPLKIYILAGQSNMQGQAQITTIPHMAMDPVTKPLHDKLVDADGRLRVHEDVRITAISKGGGWNATIDRAKQGPLTVGYGGPLESDTMFGPELAFGVTMREWAGEAILIIKTSWGGKSLYTDFRPPSAGERPINPNQEERWRKDGNHEEELAKYREKTGQCYRLMMAHVKEVLEDPGKYHPAYDPKHGHVVAGFAWFQGFNDQFEPYENLPGPDGKKSGPKDFTEYGRLLACLIRDVRKEVNTPDMPVAIAVMGIDGHQANGQEGLRKAMAAPADMPEFKGTVAAVQTADFWDEELVEAVGRVGKLQDIQQVAYGVTLEGEIDYTSSKTKGWQPITKEPRWRYVSLETDPEAQYEKLRDGDDRLFKEEVPTELAGWHAPDFDVSKWQEGPGPIGKGVFHRDRQRTLDAPKVHSKWGDGNMLLMRTTINVDPEQFEAFRVCIMSRQSYNIYLNGHQLFSYPWWKKGNDYRAYYLTREQAALLKTGANVLAVQANIADGEKAGINWVDMRFEGITKSDHDKLLEFYDSICSPKDIEIAKGRSNQAYHYLGSAKIYSRIGEALAKALHDMNTSSH